MMLPASLFRRWGVIGAITTSMMLPASPAIAYAPSIDGSTCGVSINGKQYYATATFTHTGGAGGSYYISRYKTGGDRIASTDFVLFQGLVTPGGVVYPAGGIVAKSNLEGNTTYFGGPEWTGWAVVWITPNESFDGTKDIKIAYLNATIKAQGTSRTCTVLAAQP